MNPDAKISLPNKSGTNSTKLSLSQKQKDGLTLENPYL